MADEMVPSVLEHSEGFTAKGPIKRFCGIWEGSQRDSENSQREHKFEWKMSIEIGTDDTPGTIIGGTDYNFVAGNAPTVVPVKVTTTESYTSLAESFNVTSSLDTFGSDPDNFNNVSRRLARQDLSSFQAGREGKFTLTGSFSSAEQFVSIDKLFAETGKKVTYKGDLRHNVLLNKNQPLHSYKADDLPFIEGSYEEFKDSKSMHGTFFLKLKTPVDI